MRSVSRVTNLGRQAALSKRFKKDLKVVAIPANDSQSYKKTEPTVKKIVANNQSTKEDRGALVEPKQELPASANNQGNCSVCWNGLWMTLGLLTGLLYMKYVS